MCGSRKKCEKPPFFIILVQRQILDGENDQNRAWLRKCKVSEKLMNGLQEKVLRTDRHDW